MKDSSVVFLKDWSTLILSLSAENQLYFWGLFMVYDHNTEIECENEYVKPIWNFIKGQLDKMKDKYIEKTVKTNRENGKLGGRPKKEETQDNPKNPMGLNETQITPKDKDKDNNKEKDNNNDLPPTAFSFYKALISNGAESKLANEWLEVRKKKKSTNSETAFEGFLREMNKGGLDINSALRICIEKSWSGLNANWLKDEIVKSVIPENETAEEKDLRIRIESFKKIKVH